MKRIALFVLLAALNACSSSLSSPGDSSGGTGGGGTGGGGTGGGGTGGGGTGGGSGGSCEIPLAQFDCASTYAQQVSAHGQGPCSPSVSSSMFRAGACGPYSVSYAFGPFGESFVYCIYDAQQALVAAESCAMGLVCDGSPGCLRGGQAAEFPSSCNGYQLPEVCAAADGGSDGAVD